VVVLPILLIAKYPETLGKIAAAPGKTGHQAPKKLA